MNGGIIVPGPVPAVLRSLAGRSINTARLRIVSCELV
jgi:hypothetical protein